MPALNPVPKVIKFIALQAVGANARVFNHAYFQYSGTLSLADLATLVNTFITAWHANVQPNQSNQVTLVSVQGTDLTSPSAPQVLTASGGIGTSATQPLPASTCAVIQLHIARRYRGGHPRIYLSGLVTSQITGTEQLAGATITAIASGFSSFLTAMQTTPPVAVGTITPVNVSYFQGFTNKSFFGGRMHAVPTPRMTPLIDTINSISVNGKIASQRRRNQQSL